MHNDFVFFPENWERISQRKISAGKRKLQKEIQKMRHSAFSFETGVSAREEHLADVSDQSAKTDQNKCSFSTFSDEFKSKLPDDA